MGKQIVLLSLIIALSATFGEYYWVTVSDTLTFADSCGCDTCSFGTVCDSLRPAVLYSEYDCDDILMSYGARRIWLNDIHYTREDAESLGCDEGYVRCHFVDTFEVDDSLFPFSPCVPLLRLSCDDIVWKVAINGTSLVSNLNFVQPCIVPYQSIFGNPDAADSNLYIHPGMNYLEVCAYSDRPQENALIYALGIPIGDTISPVIETHPNPVYFCRDCNNQIDMTILVTSDEDDIDTSSLVIRIKYNSTSTDTLRAGDIGSPYFSWDSAIYDSFIINNVPLTAFPCTVFVDSLTDWCGNNTTATYVFKAENEDCRGPKCEYGTLGRANLPISPMFPIPKLVTEMYIIDRGLAGVDTTSLGIYVEAISGVFGYANYLDTNLCDVSSRYPLEEISRIGGTGDFRIKQTHTGYLGDSLLFRSYFSCGAGDSAMGIADLVTFSGPNMMYSSGQCSLVYYIPELDLANLCITYDHPAVFAPVHVRIETSYYSGDLLTPSFDLDRSGLLQTDYSLLPWAPPPSGSYWDFAAASVYKSDAYIDRLRLFVAEYPNSYEVGVTPSGEIVPWALGALIEPDSTNPSIAEDTCCATVFEGPDTMNLYFTVDASDPLELVVREIPSYFFGIDTIDSPGRMLTVEVYDPNQQSWEALDKVPSRSMASFALVTVDDDYIDGTSLKLRLIWDSYYAIDIVGIDTIDFEIKIDTLELDQALLNGNAIVGNLTSVDSVYTRVGMDNLLEYRFDYSAPGADSAQTLIMEAVGYATYYEKADASLEATVNVSTDDITIEELNTSTAVSGAFVFIDDGTTQEAGFTDGSGVFNPDADLTYRYDIYVYKQGYRPLKVQHTDTLIYGNEIWYGDIQVLGDVIVPAGDTLMILPGTNIRVKSGGSVWNFAYDLSNNSEIMAYGGDIIAYGTEDDPILFEPHSTSTYLYQWAGVLCKHGGNLILRHVTVKYSDPGIAGIQDSEGPGRMKLNHVRTVGNAGVFGDWRNASSVDGWFQMDSCYVEGRAMWYGNEDSCWAKACSLKGSVSAGESYYTYQCGEPVEFEDCILFDYNYRGGRIYGETNFSGSVFDGTGPAAYNYKKVGFQNCDIIANNGSYALYVTSSADASGSVTADSTRFRDFSNTGVYSYKDLEFGKYNCFIRDDATYTVDGDGVVMKTDSCYFDSLVVGIVKLTNNNRVDFCISDTTLSKVIGPDGKHILPENFSLGNAVPNPFNSTVAIEIDVPKDAEVVFEVFNILGDKIITLVDEKLGRGRYRIVWDGHDSASRELPSGTYLYRLRSDDFQETKKMTLVK